MHTKTSSIPPRHDAVRQTTSSDRPPAQPSAMTRGRLSGKVLTKLRAQDEDLSGTDLSNCTAQAARLSTCDLSRAYLTASDWSGATLRLCNLHRINAQGAIFKDARIEDCAATSADLSNADLSQTGLTDSDFSRADLSGANLSAARGESVDFSGAGLRGSRLVGCDLPDAEFRGADLRGADMSGGRFVGADFRGAQLDGVVRDGSVFTGAQFDKDSATTGSDFETLIQRLQETDIADHVARATGLQDDMRQRLEAVFQSGAETDVGALLGEAFAFFKASGDATDDGTAEERLAKGLAAAPQVSRLLAAAELDPAMLAGLTAGDDGPVSPDLATAFLGPMTEAMGLAPDTEPQALIDALMGPGGPLATGTARGGKRDET